MPTDSENTAQPPRDVDGEATASSQQQHESQRMQLLLALEGLAKTEAHLERARALEALAHAEEALATADQALGLAKEADDMMRHAIAHLAAATRETELVAKARVEERHILDLPAEQTRDMGHRDD